MSNSDPGYVYALINPSLEGMVKIGKTTREPADRAAELSSATGVPTPFIVAYDEYFSDVFSAEEYVHTLLEHKGYRLTKNREFFSVPIKEVVLALQQAKGELEGVSQHIKDSQTPTPGQHKIIEELMELAQKYNYGVDDYLEDKDKALELYTNAIKLGHYEACLACGYIYRDHLKNGAKALELFKKGSEKMEKKENRAGCFAGMAEIYGAEGHTRNALKCWEKCFSMKNIEDVNDYSVEYMVDYVFQYIATARKEYATPQYKDKLIKSLEMMLDKSNRQRKMDLERSHTTLITEVHLATYTVYIDALKNDDYSNVDEHFPDGPDLINWIEIDGKIIRLP